MIKAAFIAIPSLLLGAWLSLHFLTTKAVTTGAEVNKEPEPMYWVAPMDPNYQRDKPGLSPMGMALVPVYENTNSAEVGTIKINPSVVNNIGVRTEKVKYGYLHTQIKTVGYVNYNPVSYTHLTLPTTPYV